MNELIEKSVASSADDLRRICERYGILRLSVFGSALGDSFSESSDLDLIAEFLPGRTPGLAFVRLQRELSDLLGRDVDLHTPKSLSRYFRDEVLRESEELFTAGTPAKRDRARA